jgi:phosphohistidine phosphatase
MLLKKPGHPQRRKDMRLYLMRHGPYLSNDRDPEEGLSPQGKEVVRRVAHGLKDLGVAPDVLVTSPKKRARETAAIAAQVLGFAESEIQETKLVKSMTPPEETLRHLSGLSGQRILSVGHLPNVRLVASLLLCGHDQAEIIFEPGSVCALDTDEMPAGRAALRWLLKP